MIIGEYPCCEGPLNLVIPLGRRLPAYFRETCPHCGQIVWHRLSRWDPKSWVETDFLEEHDIDPRTRTITKKGERR